MTNIYVGKFTCRNNEGTWLTEKVYVDAFNKTDALYWMLRLLTDKYEFCDILPNYIIKKEDK